MAQLSQGCQICKQHRGRQRNHQAKQNQTKQKYITIELNWISWRKSIQNKPSQMMNSKKKPNKSAGIAETRWLWSKIEEEEKKKFNAKKMPKLNVW